MKAGFYAVAIIAILFLFCCPLSGSAQSDVGVLPPQSMKGFELYSWKVGREWHFSLLVGTNRLKTRKEVLRARTRVKGSEALKALLDRLGRGEELLWSDGHVSQMALPPDSLVEEIKRYCDERGLVLRVSRRSADGAKRKSLKTASGSSTGL